MHLFLAFFVFVAYAEQQQTCPFCEFVIQTAEGYILNNATEQEILSLIENACTVLPSPYNALCTQEVKTNGPQIILWIANKESPEVVCTQLHFCTSSSKKALQGSCGICELVVTYAENFLASNGTVAELEAYLEGVCMVLPAPFGAECTAFLDAQLPALISWLLAMEPPELFCTQIGVCTSTHPKKNVPYKGNNFIGIPQH